MSKLAEDLLFSRPARDPVESNAPSRRPRASISLLMGLLALLAFSAPASADDDGFDLDELLPQSLRYGEELERRPPSISFRRDQARAVEAPTRFRTTSILKYSTPIGNTGMIFRVKARPNPRRIVKLEVRF